MTVYSDTKRRKSRGGGSFYYNQTAADRARSKTQFDKVKASADPAAFLRGLTNQELMALASATKKVSRYGNTDWNRIVALLPDGEEEVLRARIEAGRKEQLAAQEARNREWQAGQEERARQRVEAQQRKVDESRLIAGHLRSELAAAIRRREAYGQYDGEWLDDPVAALTGQGGFGEEIIETCGIKLEVNLCLDCSNSMVRNRLDEVSTNVMRTLYLALDLVAKELPEGTLTVTPWLWAKGEDGKTVRNLSRRWGNVVEVTDDSPLGPMGDLPNYNWEWDGEDTWIYPLLDAIRKREERYGDFGAFRLDIILTDGVLEHKTDSRRGDAIQDVRDGNLQSVVLNFLPMELWGDYRVPNRCVQYEATVENIGNLMRQVLGDWIVGVI